jgi:predicted ATPase
MSQGERLVGRDATLVVLRAALQDAAGGRGQVALLAGEAGIGKTALAAELARQAAGAGARVLWGQCWQGEAVPAYWPWVQVLRAAAEGSPADALGDAARLLPGAAEAEAPAGRGGEPEAARFRLFDAVVRALSGLAAREPLLVVVDDLHWADEASLRLLAFAARHLAPSPVLLLGTYRDLEAPAGLHELAGAGQVVPLAGLAPAEVAALMEAVTGRRPPDALAAEVWRRTGGNPFFVRELARLQTAQPARGGGGSAPAPTMLDSVRDTLERRLARLSQPCAELLAVAAVAGPEVGVEVLARVLPDRRADLADQLDEAVRARVLIAPAAPLGPYRFAHDLFRETLYEGLPAAQRAGLHLAVGCALEELRAEGASLHAAELAAHYLAAASAGATGEAAQAVHWSVLAAREAAVRLAF